MFRGESLTKVQKDRLNDHRYRNMVCVFILTKGKTTLDPTGSLMGKQFGAILRVNFNDFEEMRLRHKWSQEKAISYLECVSGCPFLDTDRVEYLIENVSHSPLTSNLTFVDGDTLVEWPKADTFWKVNDYSPFVNRDDMLEAHITTFRRYMSANPSHVILFNGGADFAERYRKDIQANVAIGSSAIRRNIESRIRKGNLYRQPVDATSSIVAQLNYQKVLPVVSSFGEIVKPGLYMAASGTGKTTFVDERERTGSPRSVFPMNVPTILTFANAWEGWSWTDIIRSENGRASTPAVFWTKNLHESHSTHSRTFKEAQKFNPSKYVQLVYDDYDSLTDIYNEFSMFVEANQHESVLHLWTQGVFTDFQTDVAYDPSAMAQYLKSTIEADSPGSEEVINDAVNSYWNVPVITTEALSRKLGLRSSPIRYPVVGWRVCNFGLRHYVNKHPQLVPSTKIHSMLEIPIQEILASSGNDAIVKYANYSSYVVMRQIQESEIPEYDFAYERRNDGLYVMTIPKATSFVVDDPTFFNGYSSVCTSIHSLYGISKDLGFQADQLHRDMVQLSEGAKEEDVGTSGHMIAACLMYRAHLLLYLQDVVFNFRTKQSVYNLPVNEPAGGLYHTKRQYLNAIEDVKTLIDSGKTHKFASKNLNVMIRVVDAL